MIIVSNIDNFVLGYNNVELINQDGETVYLVTNDEPPSYFYVATENVSVYDIMITDASKVWKYIDGQLVEYTGPTSSLIR